jgi:excisionase family DNA binding protein
MKKKENLYRDIYTVSQAAALLAVSRQAVYVNVKKKRIVAFFVKYKWYITHENLMFWKKNRFNHHLRKHEGELIFDGKTTFSVSQTAEMLNVNNQRIYYFLRQGYLKCYLHGATKVIKREDIDKYIKENDLQICELINS